MASSKPTSHPKEKGTSPSSTTISGRRSPKPPGSPDRRLPTSTAPKPKPTPSTNATVTAATNNKSTAVSAVKRQPATKKPAEKPPSPSRKPERTLSTPTTTRERSSSKLPPPSTHSPLTKPRASNLLTSDHKGPRNVTKSSAGTGKKLGTTTFTRSKSLEKTKEVVAIPTAFVDTNSSVSDTEASPTKEVPEASFEAKEEHEEEVEQDHNPQQVESPVIIDNVEEHEDKESETEVAENKEGTNEVEEKPEEVKQEEVEVVQVDESPKEPVAEPVEEVHQPEIKAAEAKVEAPAPRVVVGTKKEVHQRSNDVIEEAKSKFLEKRKNKVLALVGAFETVMALQEPEAGGQQGQQQPSPLPRKVKETEEGSGIANESTESAL